MTKLLFDFAKALLNATLILLAVCLFLGWKLMTAAEGVTANAEAITGQVAPLRTAVTELQQEVAGLRSSVQSGTAPAERLARLEARLAQFQTALADMRTLPRHAAADAARTGAAELASRIILAVPLLKDGSACGPGES
ncbi:hypothetical protein N6L27_00785 [Leisingera sp. SS27]|uniref:hypothetical protein n=1 Tax=Leisingera sp. SS27 TaxID=2979462 RepID=UPI00232C2F80|nr:hypothetical protein [Leisingera sp. SS27]MDC0656529.1 hypothetical protein [Leisingera sp. SS27]